MELIGISGLVLGIVIVVVALSLFFAPLFIWHYAHRTADTADHIADQLNALLEHVGCDVPERPQRETLDDTLPARTSKEEALVRARARNNEPPKLAPTGGRIPGPDLRPATEHTGKCPDCGKRTRVDPAAPGLQACEHCGAEFEVG